MTSRNVGDLVADGRVQDRRGRRGGSAASFASQSLAGITEVPVKRTDFVLVRRAGYRLGHKKSLY
jgi:hypothetical protein